jgi:hypothetical protein
METVNDDYADARRHWAASRDSAKWACEIK